MSQWAKYILLKRKLEIQKGWILLPEFTGLTPTATAATSVGFEDFTANWNAVTGAASYRLDVSTSDTFATFVTGYEDKTVSGTTDSVSGLDELTTYYYRVRAVDSYDRATANSNTITQATEEAPEIGDEMEGGKLAYLGSAGDFVNGMIAAAADTSTGHQWGCRSTTIGGAATATAIGTGEAATAAIVDGCNMDESLVAAKLCNNLTLNGYSDWFLPSEQELNQMYQNKGVIDGFATARYWSSSESSRYARRQDFYFGFISSVLKNNSYRVRAVRGF